MYNIVFMGTPDFAVESLKAINEAGHNILLAVSQPDKPQGRKMQIKPTPVKEYCIEHNINILQPEKIRKNEEFVNIIKELHPDIIIVVAYGKILPKAILDIPTKGCINVHGSLLPNYRGAAPIQWAIINGDKTTGITTMFMDEGMDTGDMLLKEEVIIEKTDTYGTLYEKLKLIGGKLLAETLEKLENIKPEKQDDEYTIAPMIEKNMGKLNFKEKTAIELNNLVKGFNPIPGAYFNIEDKVYKVWETEVLEENTEKEAGTIIKADNKNGLLIQTKNNILSIKIIQAENSKKMNIYDFLRGNSIKTDIII